VDTALTVRGVSVQFGGTRALDSVDLEVKPGEVRALVGENGSGKSTLVKVLAGVHTPEPGAMVEVAGQPFSFGTAGAGDSLGLRFVHQDLGLVDSMDVVDNLAVGRGYRYVRNGVIMWRREAHAAHEALAALGYDVDVRRPVIELSMSERTAVAIARAVLPGKIETRMLILDEPTANLPATEARRLFELIRRVRDNGTAILFVSHHFAEVFAIADTATVLRDGKMVTTQRISDITEDELITHVVGAKLAQETGLEEPYTAAGSVALSIESLGGRVIDNLNLEVHAGEVVGVAGTTGSGREELPGLLFGDGPRTGTVRVAGKVLPAMKPHRAIAMGVGLVPAERRTRAAFMEACLRENVTIIDTNRNKRFGLISKSKERKDTLAWLRRLNVRPPQPETRIEDLSGGNQQKVILSRWLRQSPKLLILDDPTQGVDVGAKAEIHSLIEEAANEGMAVLIASTDEAELARLCHRVLVLRQGKVRHEMFAPNMTADELTARTIGGTV